jgi:hypothetical protein
MIIDLGQVRELYRYPVTSMAPVAVQSTLLGWHGVEGDRRFACHRMSDNNGFPWLTTSRLPSLILYQPIGQDTSVNDLPEEALVGLEAFSHAEVIFIFDQVAPAMIVSGARHPRNNPAWPAVGIFAQRET